MSYKQYQKGNRFDMMMYSQPQFVIFQYTPQVNHIRLLQLQKHIQTKQNSIYSHQSNRSFSFNNSNTSSSGFNLNNNNPYNNPNIHQQNGLIFNSKRCYLFDSNLALIQKKQQGKPINYKRKYKQLLQKQLKNKIYNWYNNKQQIVIRNDITQQYYYYKEINNVCFGRKHFVRSINGIELSSDHISRNHCQIMRQKGKGKYQIKKYFNSIFGVYQNKYSKTNKQIQIKGKSIKQVKLKNIRRKISKYNKLMKISDQLWQKIYQYIFLTRDKYYLIDNGSRNGTFFIQCNQTNNKRNNKDKRNNIISHINSQMQGYNNGNKIQINHKVKIKQGYSYQYEGQQYLIKIWRLTEDHNQYNKYQQLNKFNNQQLYQGQQPLIQQNNNHIDETNRIKQTNKLFPNYMHNEKTIKNIKQFEQKINWFNNFQKVSKDYIIHQNLLKRQNWKGKLVYENMYNQKMKKYKANKQNIRNNNNNINRNIQRNENRIYSLDQVLNNQTDQQESNSNQLNSQIINYSQNEQNQQQLSSLQYLSQQSALIQSNPNYVQNQYISKSQFVKLVYQQYVMQYKTIKSKSLNGYSNNNKYQSLMKQFKSNKSFNQQSNQFNQQNKQQNQYKQNKDKYFIDQHKLNAMVISLDFNNDYKKLYCIITQSQQYKKYHIGSQMVINTARFQFDQINKCNGYIQFDKYQWNLIALKNKQTTSQNHYYINNNNINSNNQRNQYNSQSDERQQDQYDQQWHKFKIYNWSKRQSNKQFNKSNHNKNNPQFNSNNNKNNNNKNINISNYKHRINLTKQISNKIWTKIPSTYHYQLNPIKCSKYLIRLAHSFYFQLKFINYNPKHQLQSFNQSY